MSDVTFILGKEGIPLRAHKIFLMTSSSVIYKLITKSTEQCPNIKIQQISKPIMLEICRYAYTDEVKLTTENMLEIFYAASTFEIKILTEKTVDYICKQMSDKTVYKILESNQTHNNLRINMKCFEYIEKNYQLCLENPDFLKISSKMLRTILSTCKISQKSAMVAIKKRAGVNALDDLDELMGIVAIKNFNEGSETVEVLKFGTTKPTIYSKRYLQPKPPAIKSSTSTSFFQDTSTNHSIFAPLNSEKAGKKIFRIYGITTERVYKYANLDVIIGTKNIFLHSLEFIYDLKTTDKEFEISVIELDDNRRLFNDKVVINSESNAMTSFDFKQKIELKAGKTILFKIEYTKAESRKTFDRFSASIFQDKDIILRKGYPYDSYAENICGILYTFS